MFLNSFGDTVSPNTSIFPLVSFNPTTERWKCLGTGFFIQARGGFVTAKHVFFGNDGVHVPTLYAVQSTNNGERVLRSIRQFSPHATADIGVGFLGPVRNHPEFINDAPIASAFSLSLKPIATGDKIQTYAFPLTETEDTPDGAQEFTFKGGWSNGNIIDYHPDGISLLKNPCYQTSMKIEHGASGGPVLRGAYVIGVNSTGFDLFSEEEPISFITPISLIADIPVKSNEGHVLVSEIIKQGGLSVQE